MSWASFEDFSVQIKADLNVSFFFFLPFPIYLHHAFLVFVCLIFLAIPQGMQCLPWQRAMLSLARLFATPWTIAHQAPLSMGIHQARILEWVAMPSSRGSLRPRDQTHISFGSPIVGKFFTTDPPEKLVSLCLFFLKKFRFGEGVKIDTCTQSTILTRIHYLIVFFLHL